MGPLGPSVPNLTATPKDCPSVSNGIKYVVSLSSLPLLVFPSSVVVVLVSVLFAAVDLLSAVLLSGPRFGLVELLFSLPPTDMLDERDPDLKRNDAQELSNNYSVIKNDRKLKEGH